MLLEPFLLAAANLEHELADVAEQLLRDALARAVDGDLDARGRVQHRRGKHGDGDGLAEAPRRADEHLLREVVPAVAHEDGLVVARKGAGRLELPEDARAGLLCSVYIRLVYALQLTTREPVKSMLK